MLNANAAPPAAYGDLPEHLRQGETSPHMQSALLSGIKNALIAILGVAAFSAICFLGAPFWLSVIVNAWFAGSAVYLSGLTYGIFNDLIGVNRCLPYFSLGHQWSQKALIESNDRTAVGIAWGILATSGLSTLAAAVFAVATLVTGLLGLPFAGFIFPLIACALPFAILGAHLHARHKEKQRLANNAEELHSTPGANDYQRSRLQYWLKNPDDRNAWYGNSDRNEFGYMSMPLLGFGGLVALVYCSALHTLLPAALFGATFTVAAPLGLGIVFAAGIMAACTYLFVNHKKPVNNGYRLDFTEGHSAEPTPARRELATRLIADELNLMLNRPLAPGPIALPEPAHQRTENAAGERDAIIEIDPRHPLQASGARPR